MAFKTLANCTAIEGLKQINKIKKHISGYYDEIGVPALKEKYKKLTETEPPEKKDELSKQFMDDIFEAALEANAEKTIAIVGMLAFLTPEESAKLTLDEAYDIITESMKSRAVMDFFSSAVTSVKKGTGNT